MLFICQYTSHLRINNDSRSISKKCPIQVRTNFIDQELCFEQNHKQKTDASSLNFARFKIWEYNYQFSLYSAAQCIRQSKRYFDFPVPSISQKRRRHRNGTVARKRECSTLPRVRRICLPESFPRGSYQRHQIAADSPFHIKIF